MLHNKVTARWDIALKEQRTQSLEVFRLEARRLEPEMEGTPPTASRTSITNMKPEFSEIPGSYAREHAKPTRPQSELVACYELSAARSHRKSGPKNAASSDEPERIRFRS